MFKGKLPILELCAATLLATTGAVACLAQNDQTQTKPPELLTSHYVKTGLYVISGGGGNTVLRLSGNGLVLVDGKLAGNFEELLLRVKKIVDRPIRVVVNTDHYEDHTGTNARFLADGIQVVAQENVRKNLREYHPSGDKIAAPSAVYDRNRSLNFGLVEVRLLHFGSARTDGDTVVYFPDLKAVAVGDLYAPTPEPDYTSGGSLIGWSAVLDQVLKLDFTVAVPGTGPTVSRNDLEVFKGKIDTVVLRSRELIRNGVPKEQLISKLKTDDLGWKLEFSGAQLDGLYAELSQTK